MLGKAPSHIVRLVSGGQARDGTQRDLVRFWKLTNVTFRDLHRRRIVNPGASGDIHEYSCGIALVQKIKGKRGASISLAGQDQDQIRRLRRVYFEEFSGICRKEKRAREQQEKEHRAELSTRGHGHERLCCDDRNCLYAERLDGIEQRVQRVFSMLKLLRFQAIITLHKNNL